MAIAPVQQKFGFFDGSSQSSLAVTFTGTVASGNSVVVFLKHGATGTISGLTDDKSNTYAPVDTILGGAANANELRSYVARNITNAPQTVTVSYTGSNGVYPRLTLSEWSGADTTASIVNAHEAASQTSPGAGTDAITSAGSASTSVANCMLVAFCQDHDTQGSGSNVPADGTSFSGAINGITSPNLFDCSRLSYRILASAGSAHATFSQGSTTGTTDHYTTMLVALQPPQAGGAPHAKAIQIIGLQARNRANL
jgi:hypothetical protein